MEDRTIIMGGGPADGQERTVLSGSMTQTGLDPMRTVMGGPAQTLTVECLAGNRYAIAPETTREHALVVLKATGQQLGRRAPLNVCLCIDRSGSMEGEPLDYVKRACDFVVDMLEPTDILS
ncbi:MAG TPA: hypothetical protein VGS41_08165, partial [Chthonomonadales bacterium]|nr:hypothetical protein [Chthonomonadales bacterium]